MLELQATIRWRILVLGGTCRNKTNIIQKSVELDTLESTYSFCRDGVVHFETGLL